MSQTDFVARGQALVASGQYQEAVKVCRLGLLGRPTTVEGRVVLGSALLALKRFDEVLAEMRVALELDHNSVGAQTLKAEALLKKGDPDGALEVLRMVRQQAPADARVAELLGQAEGKPPPKKQSAVHPSVDFLSKSDFGEDENSEGNYTRPTSLSSPGSRSTGSRPVVGKPFGKQVLAVGDRSGTMEVDELEAIEESDDFGELAAPPPGKGAPSIEGARGSVVRGPLPRPGSKKPQLESSTVELDDDEMVEVDTGESRAVPRRAPQGPRSMVRDAVAMPAGVLGDNPRAKRPTAVGQAVSASQPPLVQQLAQQPAQFAQPFAAQPPTQLAVPQMPQMPMMPSPGVMNNAAARTIALSPQQLQSANAVDAMFPSDPVPPAPAWAQSTVVAGSAQHLQQPPSPAATEPTARPSGIDPQIQAMAENPMLAMGTEPASVSQVRPLKTGVRKARSRMQIVLWVTIGVLVIGGGVFAGFQIRAMRLRKEIDAERITAVDAAKADTYGGWSAARNSLIGILRASGTPDNRAALARTRAVIGYQFLDGIGDAKTSVDAAAGNGLDSALGAAYVALAAGDAKAAKLAAEAATKLAPTDAAVLYVTGQALALSGDLKAAAASLKSAVEADPRAFHLLGAAHVQAQLAQWDEAFANVDKVLAQTPDHPAALIERAFLLATSGRLTANATIAGETKQKLDKLVAEAGKPIAEQPRGVSAGQAAYASLALARCDFALARDYHSDMQAALDFSIEDQRFAETTAETMLAVGDSRTEKAAVYVLKVWPNSTRGRLVLAEHQLAEGKPTDALDTLGKNADVMNLPRAQAARGMARIANAELDLANQDFEGALKKTPNLELAILGRAQVMLARGDVDGARKLVEARYNVNTASLSLATTYAQVLRQSGDPASRDKARVMLERIPSTIGGPEVARAQLELARIYRDSGDGAKERSLYADAEKNGNREAPIEAGVALIDDMSDPGGGRETLNKLYARAGDKPNPRLVLETARARMLMGDHAGAQQLLENADKLPNVLRWHLDREKARLAYRKGDAPGAADAISRALDDCGGDLETFVLAADIASDDASGAKRAPLATKLKGLVDARIKALPEAAIVDGKLALAAKDLAAANTAFGKALADMDAQKASPHRRALANFGLAAVYYYNDDDPNARDKLDLVMLLDPSLYSAYAFYADILKEKDPRSALAKAKKAVDLDPDFVEGWGEVGAIAQKLGDKKTLGEAVSKINELAPTSELLKELRK